MKGFIKDEIPSRWDEAEVTHDELLAKFTDYEAHFDQVRDEEKVFAMLRAVVELTKPSEYDSSDSIYWKKAIIEAIEKGLN